MSPAKGTALDLLKQLLGGERETTPLRLAMLLEKSSSLDHGDDHYREFSPELLPRDLVHMRLSPEELDEITNVVCAEVLKNPDHALLFVMSHVETDQTIRTAVRVLVSPPRPMTILEYGAALGFVRACLGFQFARNREFLSGDELQRLIQLARELENTEESGDAYERSARLSAKIAAEDFLKTVTQFSSIGD